MAKVGTLGHKLAEAMLEEAPIELTDDDRETLDGLNADERKWLKRAVAMCVDFVKDQISNLSENSEYHYERKIPSAFIDEHGGTSDATLVDFKKRVLWVIDFKFGAEAIEADDNEQVMCYLNLAREVHPETEKGKWAFKGTIIQPSYRGAQTYTYDREQLEEFRAKCIWATTTNERHGDPEWCKYCPLLVTCDQAAKMVVRAVDEFGTCTDVVNEVESGSPTPEQIEKLERIVMMHKLAKDAYEGASTILKTWHNQGAKLKYHRVSGSNIRSWNRRAYAHLVDTLPPDVLSEALKIDVVTPHKLQTLLGMKKAEFNEKYSSILELTSRPTLKCGVKPSPDELAQDLPIWTGKDD